MKLKFLLPILLLSLALLSGCSSYSARNTMVGSYDIVGTITEASTSDPVTSALVVVTISEGNSWSLPSSFLVGYAYTESNGRFIIPAQPRQVRDIRNYRASVTIDAYHPAYNQSVAFVTRSKKAEPVTLKMKKADSSRPSPHDCTYNNPEICNIVNSYLGY